MEENMPYAATKHVWRAPDLPVVGVIYEPFATMFPPFYEAGYQPIPLRRGQKAPAIGKYNQFAEPYKNIGKGHAQAWLKKHPGGNIGLVCGKHVRDTEDGKPLYITAIDIDTNDERVWDAVTGSMPDWEKAVIKTSLFKGVDKTKARGCTLIVLSTMAFTYGKQYALDKLNKEDHVNGPKQPHIDFIASGMQTALGGMHPETEKPYIVTHGYDQKTGWVRPIDELPIFDQTAFDRLAQALEFACSERMLSPEQEQVALEGTAVTLSRPRERTLGGERTSHGLKEFIKGVERILSRDWKDPKDRPNYQRLFGQMADLWRVINEGELSETEAILVLMGTDIYQDKVTSRGQKWVDGEWKRAETYVKGERQTGAQIVAERQAAKTEALGWDDRLIKIGKTAEAVSPTPEQLHHFTDNETVEKALKNADDDGIEMPTEPNLTDMAPLPQELIDSAPGLVGRIKDEILTMNRGASGTLAISTALSIVAQIGSRRVFGAPVGNSLPCRLYVMNFMGTSAGKNVFPQFMRQLQSALVERTKGEKDKPYWVFNYKDCEKRYDYKHTNTYGAGGAQKPSDLEHISAFENWEGSAGYTGASAVWTDIWNTATPFIIIDEYGEVADGMSKVGYGGSAFTVLRTFFADVNGERMIGFALNSEAKKDKLLMAMRRRPVYSPSPNISVFSTPEQVFAGGGGSAARVKDGTLNRFVFFYDEQPERTFEEVDAFLWESKSRTDISDDLIDEILERYASLHEVGNLVDQEYINTMDDTSDPFTPTKNRKVVSYDDLETRVLMSQHYYRFYSRVVGLTKKKTPHDAGQGQMLGRVPENFFRLCLICAVADPHPEKGIVFQKHHVEWAAGVMENVSHNISSIYKTQMSSYRENKATADELYVYDRMNKVASNYAAGAYEDNRKDKRAVVQIEDRIYVKKSLVRQAADKNKRTTFDATVLKLHRAGVIEAININKDGKVTAVGGSVYISADDAFEGTK